MAFVTGSPRRALVLAALLVLPLAAACSEKLETTGTCPVLCPDQGVTRQESVIPPFSVDTTIVGIPLLGQSMYTMIARAGDTLDVRGIMRFDAPPRFFRPSAGTDSTAITTLQDAFVSVVVDRLVSLLPAPVTLEMYDVDGPGSDTAVAVLAPRFAPERLLGSVVAPPLGAGDTTRFDTLQVPVPTAALLAKLAADLPLRVGLRVVSAGDARVLIVPGNTQLSYDPSPDTTIGPIQISARSITPANNIQQRSDESEFTLVVAGSPGLPDDVEHLTVGGLPGRRSLLQFDIPRAIADSATIVRATLVLTQTPVRGFRALDTLVLLPRPVLASPEVVDPFRLAQLAANPFENIPGAEQRPLDSLRLSPSDSGDVEFELGRLILFWRENVPGTPQRAVVLRSQLEGASPLAVRFFSAQATMEAVRPRLRLTYIPPVAIARP
jgi:hypothetical protein